MFDWLTQNGMVWYLNRGAGVVLVALLTLSTALGVMSTARASTARWPRFATQGLHRNVALLTMVMLAVHIATGVLDTYIHLSWLDAFIPFIAGWRPGLLGLGTLATDIMVIATVTSLVRHRMSHRAWRGLHLVTYAAWGLGVLHGVGIGSDATTGWGFGVTVGSVGVVGAVAVVRLATLAHERRLAA